MTSFDTQFDTQLDTQIVPRSAIPQHIAIIMDGNNRWAQRRGLSGVAGHRAGVEVVRTILEACDKRGVKVLTLFAFSSENWGRPEPEVRALMALLSRYLRREAKNYTETIFACVLSADGIESVRDSSAYLNEPSS